MIYPLLVAATLTFLGAFHVQLSLKVVTLVDDNVWYNMTSSTHRSHLFVHICISSDTFAEKEERNSNEVCSLDGAHQKAPLEQLDHLSFPCHFFAVLCLLVGESGHSGFLAILIARDTQPIDLHNEEGMYMQC